MRPAFGIVFLGFTILVFTALFTHACGCAEDAAKVTACLTNVKRQALGLTQYAADHDDRFPSRDLWMDDAAPYVKEPLVFHAPEAPKGTYGYAFNATLSSATEPKRPENALLVYDSTNPTRNASDRATSLPRPGRHDGKNHIAYVDGHAKAVTP